MAYEGIYINGPAVVRVKGGSQTSLSALYNASGNITTVTTLGVTEGPVRVIWDFKHHNVMTDIAGRSVPAEIMSELVEAKVSMDLVYFDPFVLDTCIREAAAGYDVAGYTNNVGGRMMGRGQALYASGNHYISLSILEAEYGYALGPFDRPHRFQASFLEGRNEWPLSVKRSVVHLDWRAISYVNPSDSVQNPVWDNTND